jgi:Bacterial capsule synthesis protein PGA_cap
MRRTGRSIIQLLPLFILLAACSLSSLPQDPGNSSTDAPFIASPTLLASSTSTLLPSLSTVITEQPQATVLPSPAPEIKLWVDPYLPMKLQQLIRSNIEQQGTLLLSADADSADLHIQVSDQNVLGEWVYALVAPFPTLTDGVNAQDILATWNGDRSSSHPDQLLVVDEISHAIFTRLWGKPDSASVKMLPEGDLVDFAWENQPTWALVPFEDLEPRWKVLEVNGQSPIRKEFDFSGYPLLVPIGIKGSDDLFVSSDIGSWDLPFSNRNKDMLTTLSLTGVTALVRGTALTMEQKGIRYPAQDIGAILRDSDLAHVNNEIPFLLDCPFPELYPSALVFCSRPAYIGLLEELGTDIIELSGDHFADHGPEAMLLTLGMYAERGWQVYGGGENEDRAREPVLIDHNGNQIAMLGCNIGCKIKTEINCKALAQADQPGAATCDFDWLDGEIKRLTDQGYSVVFTFQHKEYFTYTPQPDLVRDFGRVAQAGASIVSGSQAHQPHAMTLEDDTFIHYGLGNLFFDQYNYCADNVCNDGFIDRHVFYDNRYISTELITIRFVDMARPRLMTPEERTKFLQLIFETSGW